LLAPCRIGAEVYPTHCEVAEAVAALAEEPEAARALLTRGLGEQWWQSVDQLNRVLRLTGTVLTVYDAPLEALPAPEAGLAACLEPRAEAVAAVRRAKLVLLGPGNPDVNLLPALAAPALRAALNENRGDCLRVEEKKQAGPLDAWLGEVARVTSPAAWQDDAQRLLLAQAASRAKTSA
jgi:hypothetical protein